MFRIAPNKSLMYSLSRQIFLKNLRACSNDYGYDFLLVIYSNYGLISCRFRYKRQFGREKKNTEIDYLISGVFQQPKHPT